MSASTSMEDIDHYMFYLTRRIKRYIESGGLLSEGPDDYRQAIDVLANKYHVTTATIEEGIAWQLEDPLLEELLRTKSPTPTPFSKGNWFGHILPIRSLTEFVSEDVL